MSDDDGGDNGDGGLFSPCSQTSTSFRTSVIHHLALFIGLQGSQLYYISTNSTFEELNGVVVSETKSFKSHLPCSLRSNYYLDQHDPFDFLDFSLFVNGVSLSKERKYPKFPEQRQAFLTEITP